MVVCIGVGIVVWLGLWTRWTCAIVQIHVIHAVLGIWVPAVGGIYVLVAYMGWRRRYAWFA